MTFLLPVAIDGRAAGGRRHRMEVRAVRRGFVVVFAPVHAARLMVANRPALVVGRIGERRIGPFGASGTTRRGARCGRLEIRFGTSRVDVLIAGVAVGSAHRIELVLRRYALDWFVLA